MVQKVSFDGATCLGSGALPDAAAAPYKVKGSDEQLLMPSLLDTLQGDNILLGDTFFTHPTFFTANWSAWRRCAVRTVWCAQTQQ